VRRLTDQELDEISEVAADAAEKFIFSKISKKEVLDLDINVELDHHDGLDVDVVVEILLDDLSSADESIADEAASYAIKAIDKFVEDL
jgi:hypothetical protein